jgi:hypothetical protein
VGSFRFSNHSFRIFFRCPRTDSDFIAKSGTVVRPEPTDSLCDCDYLTEDSSLISYQYFLPAVFRDESTLKRYIRDPRFQQLRRTCNDTLAVDAIFAHAFEIADGTMSHALLVAALATFDHFRIGVKIPLLGAIYLPLTIVESQKEFNGRYVHLPRHVLPDSLGGEKETGISCSIFSALRISHTSSIQKLLQTFSEILSNGANRCLLSEGIMMSGISTLIISDRNSACGCWTVKR